MKLGSVFLNSEKMLSSMNIALDVGAADMCIGELSALPSILQPISSKYKRE